MVEELSGAKWGYVTRRVPRDGGWTVGDMLESPMPGDFAVMSVAHIGEHEYLENIHGRRMRMYPGDLVVGAFGNRYATDFYEGYLPTSDEPLHLLTSGGLLGTVTSAHTSRSEPTRLEVVGRLIGDGGRTLNTDDVSLVATAVPAAGTGRSPVPTVVVLGSAMNAGKTTATSAIVHGLATKGRRPGAGKVTGSGSGKDHWSYVDAGAAYVSDFLDFGMPSTFGYPPERLVAAMHAIRDKLVADGADVVVLEIADGLLHSETAALAGQLPGFADTVVLAVGDALGAVAGVKVLAAAGVTVDAVSGLVTASPLAIRETVEATGLPVYTPARLVARATALADGGHLPADGDELGPDTDRDGLDRDGLDRDGLDRDGDPDRDRSVLDREELREVGPRGGVGLLRGGGPRAAEAGVRPLP